MPTVIVDSAIPLHAEGAGGPLRDPCRAVMEAIGAGRLEAHASVELIQEYSHVRRRRGTTVAALAERVELLRRALRLIAFEPDHIPDVLRLLRANPQLEVRDAVHAAAAAAEGIDVIVTPDADFDGVENLHRVDPRDLAAVEGLLGD